jgi:hypothetical protein
MNFPLISRGIAAAATFTEFLAKAVSTFIFINPLGGGIHRAFVVLQAAPSFVASQAGDLPQSW